MNRRGRDWLARRSTGVSAREGRRTPGYGLRHFVHGYVYAR